MAGGGQEQRAPVQLDYAAPVAMLEDWLQAAPAGQQAIYATGIDLPRSADAVKLVTRWIEQGLVRAFMQPDPVPAVPPRKRWLVEKAAPIPAKPRLTRTALEVERCAARSILRLLRDCAHRGDPCPSNSALAAYLGLHGEKGRARAQYLLGKLVREGAITIDSRPREHRVVTITAPGTGKGKSTATSAASAGLKGRKGNRPPAGAPQRSGGIGAEEQAADAARSTSTRKFA